ncbi:PaaI family thioesterase [Halorubrum tebenquichense]|uniref:Thioesterase superfamily protein n=1 Tax=Halorubrum tebenquichense DSM 14210 TaxID=1227485 RepID=M0DVA1_9EURY|nr:PaaI family thioesterase [Halorubrum tebenquichense]ELZ39450.1 thioesterase superfamily protein [Halorubrum tebenquichense DSM 14210]
MDRTEIAAMDPLPSEATAFVERKLEDEHGYLSWLNTSVEVIERGRVVLSIPFDDKLTNADGRTIHGGVAATLIDTAGGVAQRTAFEDPLDGGVATVNLNANYLRPATGDLRAEAEVVRAGGSIGVSDMTVTTAGEREGADGGGDDGGEGADRSEVVVGQGSFRLFRE